MRTLKFKLSTLTPFGSFVAEKAALALGFVGLVFCLVDWPNLRSWTPDSCSNSTSFLAWIWICLCSSGERTLPPPRGNMGSSSLRREITGGALAWLAVLSSCFGAAALSLGLDAACDLARLDGGSPEILLAGVAWEDLFSGASLRFKEPMSATIQLGFHHCWSCSTANSAVPENSGRELVALSGGRKKILAGLPLTAEAWVGDKITPTANWMTRPTISHVIGLIAGWPPQLRQRFMRRPALRWVGLVRTRGGA